MTNYKKIFIAIFSLLLATLACNRDDLPKAWQPSIYKARQIAGIVWLDKNMNGRHDDGEEYLEGVEVELYNINDHPIGGTFTASNAVHNFDNYLINVRDFSNVDTYRLKFILPPGYRFTKKHGNEEISSSHVNPEGADVGFNDRKDFGDFRFSFQGNNAGVVRDSWTSIGDFVWHDINGNGLQDEGEQGIKDIIVTLYDGKTGDEIETTVTDSMGWYGFVVSDATPNDTFQLEFILPDGFQFTKKDVPGSVDDEDSDVYPDREMVGWTDIFTVWHREINPSGVNDRWDAGLITLPPTPTSTSTSTATLTPSATPLPSSTPTATPTEIPTATPTFIIDLDGVELDYGDAPNPYPVARDVGPWILPNTKAFLGKSIDFEIIPNVVDEDQFDDGLIALDFSAREAVLSITLTEEVLTKNDSISKLWLTLYINIVVDINDNGHWGDEGEWIVQNCATDTQNMPKNAPQTIRCPMAGGVPTIESSGTHWTRVLLSNFPPSDSKWDGSGITRAPYVFSHGEVEDYKFEDIPTGSTDGTVSVEQAHCRYGDSKAYLHKFGLKEGDLLILDGRNYLAYWLWVQPIGYDGHCWIAANLVRLPDGFDPKSLPVVDLVLPTSGHAPTPTGLSVTRQGDKATIQWDSSKIGGDDNAGYLAQVWYYQNGNFIVVALHTEKDPPVFEITADKGTEVHVRAFNVHSTGYSQYAEYRGTP